jgi:uncharacterized protein (DUF2384 family)
MKAAVRKKSPTSGPDLMAWRRERGISREIFAEMADFSVRKLATYEKAAHLPAKVVRPVTETVRLIGALGELAGDQEALSGWLHAPNRAFGKRSPLDLIKAGESDEIWQMVHQLRQGSFA